MRSKGDGIKIQNKNCWVLWLVLVESWRLCAVVKCALVVFRLPPAWASVGKYDEEKIVKATAASSCGVTYKIIRCTATLLKYNWPLAT